MRTLCVPADHPYVAHAIGRPGPRVDGLEVLPDHIPASRPPGQWWPPTALDPGALEARISRDGVDVLHVHFGFESVPLEDLRACIEVIRRHHVALVVTVHDLRNPHVEDDSKYRPRLDLLVCSAEVVITLTVAAAAEIRERWGREVTVLPHPHVAPLERVGTPRPGAGPPGQAVPGVRSPDRPCIGLSLKSLRPNTLTAAQVRQVAAAVVDAGGHLRIGVHTEALDPAFVRYDGAMVHVLSELSTGALGHAVRVDAHQRHDDDTFLEGLASHDAIVLPYRYGTHSGVLEACRDVGTPVIAPDVGCYASQADCPTYDPADIPGTLPRALAELTDSSRWTGWATDRVGRTRQAEDLRATHRSLYHLAVERAAARGPDGVAR